jgi:hypothetical protein
MFNSRTFRTMIILIVALVFASTAFALAASNTMPTEVKAGDGSSNITGFTVSNVDYILQAGNPSYIKSVDLTFAPADPVAGDVAALIGTYQASCAIDGTDDHLWHCTFADDTADVLSAASLRVIAAE